MFIYQNYLTKTIMKPTTSSKVLLFFTILLTSFYMNAQIPVLNVEGKRGSSEVYLQSLDIEVDITGNIASTKFTMTFKNRTNKILEGELLFPLPDGVTVSGFALDINGKMRQAVPVEKAKATQVFEEIEQRRVDPGILERVEGNNFRTRIYPIPSSGTRTISVSYEQELPIEKGSFRYRLPMDFKESIEQFSVNATVRQITEMPQIVERMSDELTFDKQGVNYVASFTRKDYKPERSLAFALPVPEKNPQTVVQSASGSYYFVTSCFPEKATNKKQWSDKIGIIWDVSLSGMNRDVKKELELLDIIIKEKKDLQIYLYLLNNQLKGGGVFTISGGNWNDLKTALQNVTFDGGTNYKEIDLNRSSANEFLLFSDGISSLSPSEINNNTAKGKTIHCIVSAPKADYGALKWISYQTGGKFINLNLLSDENIRTELLFESLYFLGIENSSAVREVYPSKPTPVFGNFSIAGIMDEPQAKMTLLFGYGNNVTAKISVNLDSKNAPSQGNVYRMWAQKKLNELDMLYDKNKDDINALGLQFGIVTRNTSLIVLETIEDYITYNIVPPAELKSEYLKYKKNQENELENMRKSMMAQAIAAAEDLKKWWNTDFKSQKPKYPQPDDDDIVLTDELVVFDTEMDEVREYDAVLYMAEEMEARPSTSSSSRTVSEVSAAMADEISSKKEAGNTNQRKPQPTIRLEKIKQDSKYMNNLTGKPDQDYAIYLKNRPEYITTPSFYFDMADWFYQLNARETALTILTSIADMDLENASLYRLLGYRFKEYGENAFEVYVCKKVIEWRPIEPQSYRDYALALLDAGKKQEALDSLNSILTLSFARNINARSFGIEEVIVTELNCLVALNKNLNTSRIEKKLIFPMPVNIRVVINWNMNNTDIDLHVKDPNGETCFYSHKRTALGGRISQDITQGYGPEQFLLKNAVKGKYEVFVNYFGDSQVKAEGPSTVMLEIFTDYSDGSQQRKVVCLQLSKESKKEKDGLVKVGEFEF